MDQLIDLIKQDKRYMDFKQKEQRLELVKPLLSEYKEVMEQYNELKKYESYTDLSKIKLKIKEVKQKMASCKEIVEYYQSYHILNNFLDEVTQIIFKDISDDLETSRYVLK